MLYGVAIGSSYRSNISGPAKKAFWSVLVVVTLSLLLFHTCNVVSTYFAFGVTVDVQIITQSELKFPTVTFCNVNPIKKSELSRKRDLAPDLADLLLGEDQNPGSSPSRIRNRRSIGKHNKYPDVFLVLFRAVFLIICWQQLHT